MNIKKLFFVLLSIFITLTLMASCGKNPEGDEGREETPDGGGEVLEGITTLTYEEFLALTEEEQLAYYESFESPADFMDWYNAAKAEYDETHKEPDGGESGDGSSDGGESDGGESDGGGDNTEPDGGNEKEDEKDDDTVSGGDNDSDSDSSDLGEIEGSLGVGGEVKDDEEEEKETSSDDEDKAQDPPTQPEDTNEKDNTEDDCETDQNPPAPDSNTNSGSQDSSGTGGDTSQNAPDQNESNEKDDSKDLSEIEGSLGMGGSLPYED